MAHKKVTSKKPAHQNRDEHELLQQEDFRWVAEVRDVLSPYWSSRAEYHQTNR